MENRYLALSLLFLVVIVAGCSDNEGKVSGDAITVEGPDVQPSEIFEKSSIRVGMGVENTGNIPSEVVISDITKEDLPDGSRAMTNLGVTDEIDDVNHGERILTNHCTDFFNITEFQSHSSRNPDKAYKYELKPGERAQMNWKLKQEGGNVPLNGYTCHLKFEVPFEYSVEAFKQIQIKQKDAETDLELSSKTSQGPLSIVIETIGSTSQAGAPIFLKKNNPEVLVQLLNEQPEKSTFRGLIEVEDLEIEGNGVDLGSDCTLEESDKPIKIDRNHMSDIIRCDVTDSGLGENLSMRAEITASANYTYVKNIGSRSVKVKSRGN